MTARIRLVAAVIAALLFSCDTDRNVAPVYKTYYTKYYGEDGNQFGVDLAVGADGTMILLGSSQSQTNPVTPFIVKVDGEGTVLWQRRMGGNNEVPVDVVLDSRNDILVVSNVGGSSIRVTRLSQSGAGLDSVIITHPTVSLSGTAITEISDGGLIVTGYAGPDLVDDGQLPPPDQQDLLIYRLDPDFNEPDLVIEQGGEHVGKIVKVFESSVAGPLRYYRLGDSDRPFSATGNFRQTFEVTPLDDFFQASGKAVMLDFNDVQISREAIEMDVSSQPGYLMVGSSGTGSARKIFVAQYIDGRPEVTVRFRKTIDTTTRSAEGISVAYTEEGSMFVLADELQDNNNHDIYLVKLSSDGEPLRGAEMRFGSIEGDDQAAAVRVLADQRVAIFGTIELETQKKMMLTLVSPTGTFSE